MISFEIAPWEVGEKIEQTNIHTYKQTKMTEGQLRGFIYRSRMFRIVCHNLKKDKCECHPPQPSKC